MPAEFPRNPFFEDEPVMSPALQALPRIMRRALLRICACEDGTLLGGRPSDIQDLDLGLEVSVDAVCDALSCAHRSRRAMPFRAAVGETPLTLYEICARLGTGSQQQEIRAAAQRALSTLVFSEAATLSQVLRLVRGGAEPSRRYLSSVVYRNAEGQPARKRARIEGLPFPDGTLLHWVCRVAGRLPACCHRSSEYAEIARWLCDFEPLTLLLQNDERLTPLEVLVGAWPSQDADEPGGAAGAEEPRTPAVDMTLLCAVCGVRGHCGRDCKEAIGAPPRRRVSDCSAECLIEVLIALAEGFPEAVNRYPLRAAALLTPPAAGLRGLFGGGLVFALRKARELLLAGDSPAPGIAIHGLDVALAVGGADGSAHRPPPGLPPTWTASELFAAENLAGLAHAQARSRALSLVSRAADEQSGAVDATEARARLEESEERRRRETADLERRLEALEGQLAEKQRALEEAEARGALLAASSAAGVAQTATAGDASRGAATAGGASSTSTAATDIADEVEGSPEEAFIRALRRRRLVDGGLADLPAHVCDGIARLSRSLCAAVERLASDLYESECHFLYELVQNAEDAHARARPAEAPPASLSLRLGSSAQWPAYFVSDNNEAGFTEADIEAICDISASSKKKSAGLADAPRAVIGCKGIGFKSVFTVSDKPHVLSGGYTFCFDILGPLGKLGYVTPTWLSASDLEALPEEVRGAHAAGRTVLFLPLRSPALAAAIGGEMEELEGPGRATLLFLKRLRRIELRALAAAPRVLRCSARSEDAAASIFLESGDAATEEHTYAVHRHALPGGHAGAELVLAFPMLGSDGSPAESPTPTQVGAAPSAPQPPARLEQLFCALPIRCVGFSFALHCEHFDLVANRGDLHHSSAVNRAVRDALPEAFAAACEALPKVASRALLLLGEAVADPFWRVAREGILQRLGGVACVATAAGARRPGDVLLRGRGPLRQLSELLPDDLLLQSCGRVFVGGAGGCAGRELDATEERLLRRLGAEDFGPQHVCRCLRHADDRWPGGWVATMWRRSDGPRASQEVIRVLATLYSAVGSLLFSGPGAAAGLGGDEGGLAPGVLDMASGLPELPIFPLANGVCIRLADGAVHSGPCRELPERWQYALAETGALRLLPPGLSVALDATASQLLSSLGVVVAGPGDVARAALERLLRLAPGREPVDADVDRRWAPLALLRDLWLRRGSDPCSAPAAGAVAEASAAAEPERAGEAAVRTALRAAVLSLGLCRTTEEAQAMVDSGLGSLVLVPARGDCAFMHLAAGLRCPTFLGVSGMLADDLVSRIGAFLGEGGDAPAAPQAAVSGRPDREAASGEGSPPLSPPPQSLWAELWPEPSHVQPGPSGAAWSELAESLGWETFFVRGLKMQLRSPGDPRQARAPPDLTLRLGALLGGRGAAGALDLWGLLLDEQLVPDPVFRYVCERLGRGVDRAWLTDLPVRGPLRLHDLFLRSVYLQYGGAFLEERYLDLPQLSAAGGRGAELRRRLGALGAHCGAAAGVGGAAGGGAQVAGLVAALEVLHERRCRDAGTFARIYRAILALEDTAPLRRGADAAEGVDALEAKLRKMIFHPDWPEALTAERCVWAAPPCALLARCSPLVALKDLYAPYGEAHLERYFAARRVPRGTASATAYIGMLDSIFDAAEDLGRKWRASAVDGSLINVQLNGVTFSTRPQRAEIRASEFLAEVWPAVLGLYSGMANCDESERQKLVPFSPMIPHVVLPLRCPHGGPPEEMSMASVARFHDGAIFRRLAVGEAFWEVAPDLAHSRAAEWALSGFFPPELRSLFVEVLGVREAVDRAELRAGLLRSAIHEGLRGRGVAGGVFSSVASGILRELPSGFSFLAARGGRGARSARAVNETGLPLDLGLGEVRAADDDSGEDGDADGDVFACATSVLASLRNGRRRRGLDGDRGRRRRVDGDGDGAGGALVAPALPARSVRCPATRELRLRRCGEAEPPGRADGPAVALYVPEGVDGAEPGTVAAAAPPVTAEVSRLAATLLKLAAVFRLRPECVGIVLDGAPGVGRGIVDDCAHAADPSWPLLFPVSLQASAQESGESAFWFGEFCHALAHRGAGAAHSARHSRVAQALLAMHLPLFRAVFDGAAGARLPSGAPMEPAVSLPAAPRDRRGDRGDGRRRRSSSRSRSGRNRGTGGRRRSGGRGRRHGSSSSGGIGG